MDLHLREVSGYQVSYPISALFIIMTLGSRRVHLGLILLICKSQD